MRGVSMLKRIPTVAAIILFLGCQVLSAQWQRVISYGADLSPEDRVSVVRDFALPSDVDPGQIPTITVNHAEETRLLSPVAPPEVIGTRAVSSVYIEGSSQGEGLRISTKNTTWVTPAMYANALATAGVRDALVIVTAPTAVSGTAALAGIFKSYAVLTGRALTPGAQEAAVDELIGTGELGQVYGQDQAVRFMHAAKEEVVGSQAASAETIRPIVERVAREQNLNLTVVQIQRVTEVMIRLSKLNLKPADLQTQLKNFAEQVQKPGGTSGLIARIIAFLQSIFKQLTGFVGRLFR